MVCETGVPPTFSYQLLTIISINSKKNIMTEEDCNSWACDVANDYAQAMQENGPEDYISWEEFSNLAWRELMSQPATPCVGTYSPTLEQELPF